MPITSDHNRYQWIDNFSHTLGKHDLKLGLDLNSNANSQIFIGFASGLYFFGSLENFNQPRGQRLPDFMVQLVGINGFDAVQSGTIPKFWQHELAFYAQDNWKVTRRLTLNLGLRWDGVWNPKPQFTPFPNSQPHTVPLGRPRRVGDGVELTTGPIPQDIPDDFNNWAPRIGATYDLIGDAKTILRGGFGIYYAVLPSIFMSEILSGTGLRGALVFIPFFGFPTDLTGLGLRYPNLLPTKATPAVQALLPPPLIRYADPGLESARVMNFQVGVEREIIKDLSIAGTYSFNRSDNLRIGGFLESRYDRNFRPPTRASDFDEFGRAVNVNGPGGLGRLDPTLGVADALTSFGRARYHAFILQVKKSFSHRHEFGINYIVSKNDDNASNDRDSEAFFAPSDPFNLDIDYGRSQLDIRHQFSVYGVVRLPGDIWFSTQIRARSGVVFPAYAGQCGAGDINQDGNCSGLLFDPDRPVVNGKLLPRYPFRNGSFRVWDIRVGREFALGAERVRLRLTFDVFNLTDAGNLASNGFRGSNAVVGQRGEFIDTPGFKQLDVLQSAPINAQFGAKLIF